MTDEQIKWVKGSFESMVGMQAVILHRKDMFKAKIEARLYGVYSAVLAFTAFTKEDTESNGMWLSVCGSVMTAITALTKIYFLRTAKGIEGEMSKYSVEDLQLVVKKLADKIKDMVNFNDDGATVLPFTFEGIHDPAMSLNLAGEIYGCKVIFSEVGE